MTGRWRPGPPVIQEVAPGVFAYLQPDGGWCVNNVGILHLAGEVVAIDTAATEARNVALREAIRRTCGALPHILVNTHHHGDHVFGNAIVAPDAMVIAHERTRTEMAVAGLALTTLWPDVAWGRVDVRLPSMTYRDTLTLHIADKRVELLYVGPAHTTNDTVVWLPEDRVLFAGDVLMPGCTPFCLMGSVEGTLRAVARLRALEPRVVVGGHGPVSGPEVVDETEWYLRWLQQLAAAGLAAHLSPMQAAREADYSTHMDLKDPERLVGNLHRAYAELRGAPTGQPMDVLAIFAEMVAYNGGRLPRCLA